MVGKYKIGGKICFGEIHGTLTGIKHVSKVGGSIKVTLKVDDKEQVSIDPVEEVNADQQELF